ncbi:phosphohistidine phosphatase [Croceibacterium mercuriale]|uniref:Phosphohistidine phosphatase n=1 Tax=Croceibacterium mercuriale TaxID=1572751 RepID=A0A0B2C248_9SPHN|nr:histidine phosphatase family protein [Croceibacterium mercuriale]KHL26337.1 phosphohistidine phosphatase [Croceibacterium mercuriale]
MKLLGLLRHAKSDWSESELRGGEQRDFDRGLNGRGRRGAALMGQHIIDHGVGWDRLLASPAERVRQTLAAAQLPQEPQWQDHAYLADADTLLDLVQTTGADAASLLLIGHNPGLQDLLLLLLRDLDDPLCQEAAEKFPTATFAVLELDVTSWADVSPGCARLVHFARPRDLDPALGPETSTVG